MNLAKELGIYDLCTDDLKDLRTMIKDSNEPEMVRQVLLDEVVKLLLDRQVLELMLPFVKEFIKEREL